MKLCILCSTPYQAMVSKANTGCVSEGSRSAGQETSICVVTLGISAVKERFRILRKRVIGGLDLFWEI